MEDQEIVQKVTPIIHLQLGDEFTLAEYLTADRVDSNDIGPVDDGCETEGRVLLQGRSKWFRFNHLHHKYVANGEENGYMVKSMAIQYYWAESPAVFSLSHDTNEVVLTPDKLEQRYRFMHN